MSVAKQVETNLKKKIKNKNAPSMEKHKKGEEKVNSHKKQNGKEQVDMKY